MSADVSVTREIAAPPERVFEMVSELSRMGEWSPENTGGKWLGGASGPTMGAKFKGTNKSGRHRWSTLVTVTRCEPGRAFEFEVSSMGLKVARWGYDIEPNGTGCTVTEHWTDRRGRLLATMGPVVSGSDHSGEFNRAGMQATLERLAAAAESVTTA
jgi:uncharacterized protein YndB with AHSA1/START domain